MGGGTLGSVDSGNGDAVPRLHAIDQPMIQQDIHTSRELAMRRSLGHLLDGHDLVILVLAEAVLGV
eukprot:scaffold417_cov252-Pinguiococcus_pyrenoidosus.AAC.5